MSALVRSSLVPFALALTLLAALAWPASAAAAARDVEITGVVNINTATETELRQLPGIGPAKAERILELRAKHKFENTEQLMRVKGIGRKTYRKLKPNLAIAGATTIQRRTKSGAAAARAGSDGEQANAKAESGGEQTAAPVPTAPRPATVGRTPAAPKHPVTASNAE